MYSFRIQKSQAKGQFFWNLTAGNGEKVASSHETYVRKSDCEHGISLFKKTAPSAPINDRTRQGAPARVNATEFEVYKDQKGEHRWRFQVANNNIIATSGEGYATKQGCLDAIERVKANAGTAPVYDHTKAAQTA